MCNKRERVFQTAGWFSLPHNMVAFKILQKEFGALSLSKGAFLWDDPDWDQWSEITRIMVDQMNRWIHCGKAFIGSFDLPWSMWSRITDPDVDHLKGIHPKRLLNFYPCLCSFCIDSFWLLFAIILLCYILLFLLLTQPLPVVADTLDIFTIIIIFKLAIRGSPPGSYPFQKICLTLKQTKQSKYKHKKHALTTLRLNPYSLYT